MSNHWEVCVHEAGHVVAGFHAGIPVLRAIAYRTFKPGRDLGQTIATSGYCVTDMRHFTWLMGGHVAEKVVNDRPFPEWIATSPDYIEAQARYSDKYETFLPWTEEFFEAEKATVLRVAELLRDHKGWCSRERLKAAVGE